MEGFGYLLCDVFDEMLCLKWCEGEVLGLYCFLEIFGCGGMGEVFCVERVDGEFE